MTQSATSTGPQDASPRAGILFGVGVGPGDPELLTLKALRTIERCPVLAVPHTRDGATIALDIVRAAVDLTEKAVLELPFAMERNEAARQAAYRQAADLIEPHLAAGRDVAFATIGDPSVYSTFSYLVDVVRTDGFATETIPGVPSFCAVAARLGTSLTAMGEPLALVPAGALPLEESLALPGSKVLMKAGHHLPQLVRELEEAGLLESASLVADCGRPDELVLRGTELRALANPDALVHAGYLATIILPPTRPIDTTATDN